MASSHEMVSLKGSQLNIWIEVHMLELILRIADLEFALKDLALDAVPGMTNEDY
jgi:hypothetical protein